MIFYNSIYIYSLTNTITEDTHACVLHTIQTRAMLTCDTQELFSPFIFTSLRATHRVGGHGARTHTHTHEWRAKIGRQPRGEVYSNYSASTVGLVTGDVGSRINARHFNH